MMFLAYGLVFTLYDVTVKVTVLLALAVLIALLARRASASFRHLTLALGLSCALALPWLVWNVPHWRIPVTEAPTHVRPAALPPPPAEAVSPKVAATTDPSYLSKAVSAHVPTSIVATRATPQPPFGPNIPSVPSAADTVVQLPWMAWVLLIWVFGVTLALTRLVSALLAVRRMVRETIPITIGLMADVAVAINMDIRRPIVLRQAVAPGLVTVPLTYGLWRPVVVLPAEALGWPDERLRAALLHEMAHVRRNDWVLQLMGQVVCAAYWFQPLVWITVKRMRAEAEAACDDLVLGAGMPAAEYARHLLDVALSARQSWRISGGAVAMAQSPRVEGRLRAVLAQGLSRRPMTMRRAAGLVIAALFVTLPVAALRLAVHAQAAPAADRLQLQGDFTLRYAVTITDLRSRQPLYAEYMQMRTQYQHLLKQYPHYQPIPQEAQKSFAYFLSRRPRTRHLLMTISARNGQLLYRTVEGSNTYTWVYDGHSSSLNWNGHTGQTDAGLMFGPEFTPPAVGLPHLPLVRTATLVNSVGNQQTWNVETATMGSFGPQGPPAYVQAVADAANDDGTWKLLDIDSGSQRLQFLQHQRFGGLWIAVHMTMTSYTESSSQPPMFSSPIAVQDWIEAHRTATLLNEYRLLTASSVPLGLVDFDKPAVERRVIAAAYAASVHRDILRWPLGWHVVPHSVRLSAHVQHLDVHDHTAQAVVQEDDQALVSDPLTGQRHMAEAVATFNDFWALKPYDGDVSKNWVITQGRAEDQRDEIDGKAVSVGVAIRG